MAVVTREGLLARMDALVPDEVRDLGEGLRAVGVLAAVGLLLVVHSRMFLQRRVLCEGLVTLLAFEWSVVRVGALMLSELLLVVEHPLAGFHGALENHSSLLINLMYCSARTARLAWLKTCAV